MLAWRILPFVLLLGSLLALPGGQAQTADSAEVAVCAPPYPVAATANIAAGYINFCLYYSSVVSSSATTVSVISTITAPPTVLPVFGTAASAFINFVGCTEGTPTVNPPATNGVTGTIQTYATTLTMTSEQCDGIAGVALTIGAVPLTIYLTYLPITIQTENHRVDNFNYLCDAPAIAPNAYVTTTTTCNDPNLNVAVTGTLTATLAGTLALSGTVGVSQSGSWTFALTGIPDTQQEIQAIADALAAGLDVTVCPVTSPCYHVLSGRINTDVNGTLGLTGVNVTQTIGNQSISAMFPDTLHLCGAETTPGDCAPVQAGSVELGHWLPIVAILLVLLAGIYWSNPLLMTMGFLGIFVFFASGFPLKELGWFVVIVLAMLIPAIARFHGNWKRRQVGVAPI